MPSRRAATKSASPPACPPAHRYFGENQLGGQLVDLKETLSFFAPTLTILDLHSNAITGTLPSWLGSALRNVHTLDLSRNLLSGLLPAGLPVTLTSCSLSGGGNNFSCPLAVLPPSCASVVCNCPAGQVFVQATGACAACAAGSTSAFASIACTACPPGSVASAGDAACTPCPPGTYARVSACVPCPPNSYTPNAWPGPGQAPFTGEE